MTLHTQILTHQPVDGKELHAWVNEHLLRAPHAKAYESEGRISNEMEQGLDALMWITFDPAGKAHTEWWEDEREHADLDEDSLAYYRAHAAPEGYTMLHLDTAYGYSPAPTHARMIRQLAREFFTPRGLTFAWHNEFTDEWHEGLAGLDEFGGPQGREAENWFNSDVRPSIGSMLRSARAQADPIWIHEDDFGQIW